jgi:hypothetical protein
MTCRRRPLINTAWQSQTKEKRILTAKYAKYAKTKFLYWQKTLKKISPRENAKIAQK